MDIGGILYGEIATVLLIEYLDDAIRLEKEVAGVVEGSWEM